VLSGMFSLVFRPHEIFLVNEGIHPTCRYARLTHLECDTDGVVQASVSGFLSRHLSIMDITCPRTVHLLWYHCVLRFSAMPECRRRAIFPSLSIVNFALQSFAHKASP
jgi:hypothetical protein